MFTDASYARSAGAHSISQQIHRALTAPQRQITLSGRGPSVGDGSRVARPVRDGRFHRRSGLGVCV